MRKNQAILDEAARSVRRTFVGSLLGSVSMLAVIGVAGAYGMPERLSAHALSGALTSLQIKLTPMVDSAAPIVDRAVVVADNFKHRVQPISIESDDEVIIQVPRAAFALASASPVQNVEPSRIQTLAAPVTEPIAPPADVVAMPDTTAALPVEKPVAAPVEKVVAAPVEKPVTVIPVEKPVVAPVVTAALPAPAPAIPAPSRQSRVMPGAMPAAMPDVISEPVAAPAATPPATVSAIPSTSSASMMFEQPQLDKIKPLTELPKMEIIEAPKAPQAPAKPEKAAQAPAKPDKAVQAPAKPEPQKAMPVSAAPEKPKVLATLVTSEAPTPVETRAEQPADNRVEHSADKPAETSAMSAMAKATDEVSTEEFPKSVSVHLPLPRPPMSPAQLLELHDADYEKHAKCLAQAIYFEARAEPVRGQQAVAQVVLNRVFSPYYPKDVCSVVFQNAHRHLSCQFTFACDGKPEAIRERGAWARANRIARQALDAKVWLPEVAKATHYHATYVKPDWIRDMRVMVKTGVHIFYRPRNWGDGSKELGWGTPSAAAAAAPLPTPSHKKGVKS